jgi:hypothetical protein
MARMHRVHGLIAATVAASLGAAALAAGPQVIGIAAAVLNQVRIEPSGAPARPLLVRQRVGLGDRVETGPRSQAQLMLLDKSIFTIGANARLTIDRFVYDPNKRSLTASVAKGAFRFMSGRPDRAGEATINTPVSTIGIRGTIVDGVVGGEAIAIASREQAVNPRLKSDPETASLIVLRGPGGANRLAAPGSITVSAGNRSVALDRPMLAAYVPEAGAAPIGPFTMSADGLRRLQALVFASLADQLRSSTTTGGTGFRPVTPYGGGSRRTPWTNQGQAGPWGGGPGGQLPGGQFPGGGAGPGAGAFFPSGGSGVTPIPAAPPPQQQPKQIQAPKQQNPGQPPQQQQIKGQVQQP